MLALGITLPSYFYSSLVRVHGQAFCSIKEKTFMLIYSFVDFILWYCVPLIHIIALYYKIINSLRTPGPGDSMRRHKQNRKVIKIVISIVAACFICWTPYYVYEFLLIANTDFLLKDKWSILRMLSYGLFPLLNTVINPMILFLFSTNYRSALRAMLTSYRLSQCKYSHGRLASQNERELELPGTTITEWLSQSQDIVIILSLAMWETNRFQLKTLFSQSIFRVFVYSS